MDLINFLTETKTQTTEYYNLTDADLHKSYAPGKWTVKQILAHLADAEGILHERIKRVIAEPKQVIWAFDQDLWCKNLEYETFPLEISKTIYLANRQSVIYLAGKFYPALGMKKFVHNEIGLRTLKDEFDKIAFHNQGHLKQIEIALTK